MKTLLKLLLSLFILTSINAHAELIDELDINKPQSWQHAKLSLSQKTKTLVLSNEIAKILYNNLQAVHAKPYQFTLESKQAGKVTLINGLKKQGQHLTCFQEPQIAPQQKTIVKNKNGQAKTIFYCIIRFNSLSNGSICKAS